MASQLLPIFPLSFVLLPSMPLPLHIFEERYKEMMGEILPAEGEFGVVLAKEDGIASIGCSARIDRVVNRYEDGQLDLLTIGQRRFQIRSLDQNKAYLRAEVDYFEDEDLNDVPVPLLHKARRLYLQLLQRERPHAAEEPKFEPSRMSFQIGQLLYDLDKRQTLLGVRSEMERLEYLVKIMPDYLLKQERIDLAKRVAPQNGHAKGA